MNWSSHVSTRLFASTPLLCSVKHCFHRHFASLNNLFVLCSHFYGACDLINYAPRKKELRLCLKTTGHVHHKQNCKRIEHCQGRADFDEFHDNCSF